MIKVGDNEAVVYNSLRELVVLSKNRYAKNWYTFEFYKNCQYIKNGFIRLYAELKGNAINHYANGEKALAGKQIKDHRIIYQQSEQDDEILKEIGNCLKVGDGFVVGETYCEVMCPPATLESIINKLSYLEKVHTDNNLTEYISSKENLENSI